MSAAGVTPYLSDADVTLYLGDAVDVLRGMEVGSALDELSAPSSATIEFLAPDPEGVAPGDVLVRERLDGNHTDGPGCVREVFFANDLGSMLSAFSLEFAKRQNGLGIFPLDPQVGENEPKGELGFLIADLPSVQKPSVFHTGSFRVVPAAQGVGQESHALLVDHANHQDCVVAGIYSPGEVLVRLALLDSDVALSVDEAGAVREVDLISHAIHCSGGR